MRIIPNNRGENYFREFLPSEIYFWEGGVGGISRYAATELVVALSQGHSDTNRDMESFRTR
jgi:hypothetical protein